MVDKQNTGNVGEDDLHAFVDGQLDRDRHADLMGYLAVHAEASDRVSAFLRQRVDLAALREQLGDVDPTSNFDELTRALTSGLHRQRQLRRVAGVSALCATVLLAVVSASWIVQHPGGPTRLLAGWMGPSVAPAHNLLAEADTSALKPSDAAMLWLKASMPGERIDQPSLESAGLRFVGSSMLRGAPGPAIRLAYADSANRPYQLLIGTAESGAEFTSAYVPEGKVSLSWRREGLVFALVAPNGGAPLLDVLRSASGMFEEVPIEANASLDGEAATTTEAIETIASPEPARLDLPTAPTPTTPVAPSVQGENLPKSL